VATPGYLRFPHVYDDLLAFVAEDDVWLAPAEGGRAWRLTSDGGQASHPRFAQDGATIAWTSWRDGEVLAVSAVDQPSAQRTMAYAVPLGAPPRRLPFGQVNDLALTESATVLLTGQRGDLSHWKRYRGGTAGRLWVGPATPVASDAPGAEGRIPGPFRRVLADLPAQFASPMIVGGRLAFVSDHEGTGNV